MSCHQRVLWVGGLVLSAALVLNVGCAGQGQDSALADETQCPEVKPGVVTTVNTMCVVENDDPVNPALEPVVWKGQKVGFCCKGCMPKWAALSDAQKDEYLARAIAKSKA